MAELALRVRREPYRIRLLNGANSRLQRLTWSTGETFQAVATDGELLPEVVEVPGLVLAPAQRMDLWVDFSHHEPGDRIELRTADLFVESAGMGPGMGPGRGQGPGRGDRAPTFDPVEGVAVTFVVDDSPAQPGEVPARLGGPVEVGAADAVNLDAPKQFVLSTFRASHWINDTQWEGRVGPKRRRRDRDRPARHGGGLARPAGPDRVPFRTHRGYFLHRCHILEHEDHGMMRSFLIE